MSGQLTEIKQAIDSFELEKARNLLRGELQNNPSADVFYLAAQAALNESQRLHFLEKAVNLDPFHEKATLELSKRKPSSPTNGTHGSRESAKPVTHNKSTQRETAPEATQPLQTRPTWITVWAILAIIGGIFGVIGGLATLPDTAGWLTLIVSAGTLTYGIGFLQLHDWAWQLARVVLVVGIIGGVIGLISTLSDQLLPGDVKTGMIAGYVIGFVINGLLLRYLQSERIKEVFVIYS